MMSGLRQFSFQAQSLASAAYPLTGPAGSAAAPTYGFSSTAGLGIYDSGSATMSVAIGSVQTHRFQGNNFWIVSDTATYYFGANADLAITRIAANVLGLKDGSNAQEVRVFGSATKYASLTHNNTVTILSDSGGSGTRVGSTGANVGFYGTAPVALQTGVAATATAVRQVLINLGLCT